MRASVGREESDLGERISHYLKAAKAAQFQ
jgi:hypothetical protein